jgi:hypothetical protein
VGIPEGLCQCGCGEETNKVRQTTAQRGYRKGDCRKFIGNHHRRGKIGKLSGTWKGGRTHDKKGYILVLVHGHPRANPNGYVFEHILVAEKALGKPLPPGAIPHHANENKADNSSGNLVICQDENYHRLLHKRKRALKACGHANWKKCRRCKKWDDPINFNEYGRHPDCEKSL